VKLPPFQALLDAHGADVKRFLVASVGPAEADDCAQETWIAALRAYPTLRRVDNLRAWLLRIAHNKAIDSHRARGRRAVPVGEPRAEGVAEPMAEDVSGPVTTGADGEPALWSAVRALPPKQRAAVFCRSALGMPYDELAGLLDCSPEAARRSVHEGLERLKEEWTR
jgi:RNA polymerase sigma factor (sigma-70 family)